VTFFRRSCLYSISPPSLVAEVLANLPRHNLLKGARPHGSRELYQNGVSFPFFLQAPSFGLRKAADSCVVEASPSKSSWLGSCSLFSLHLNVIMRVNFFFRRLRMSLSPDSVSLLAIFLYPVCLLVFPQLPLKSGRKAHSVEKLPVALSSYFRNPHSFRSLI